MYPVGLAVVQHFNIALQIAKIGRQNGWGYQVVHVSKIVISDWRWIIS
jgi:hypothetical protein